MKTYTDKINATITAAAAAITAAASSSLTEILAAKASVAIVIRDQVAVLRRAAVTDRDIASIVRDAVGAAVVPSTISRTLVSCGIRLRGKRSDADHLRAADRLLSGAVTAKPAPADEDEDEDEDEEADESGADDSDESGSSGHTATTLAALLGSLDPALVAEALVLAGLA